MRLLIVEDEHRIANMLKKGFELERYAVDVAYDGLDGYDLAVGETYDVIVLDYMLPSMDGLTVCKKVRAEKNHTPILMLTAKNSKSDIVACLDAGADDYLTKPFAFEELLARVRALMRRPNTQVSTLLQVEDLTLDPQTFAVKRGDVDIRLSSKEYALLEYLMRNAGKVLTKDQIISHVWDYESDILPNTVEVYIRNLRSKIDKPFPRLPDLIQTQRGFGYRLGGG